jgi:class 3 adenylate cyclase
VVLLLGNPQYYRTLPFYFDIICLVSMLQDTWILEQVLRGFSAEDSILSEQSTRVSRLARSSRAVRLLRVSKIARVARLVPHLMALFRTQNMRLGHMVLKRRLWRIFSLLDLKGCGKISVFDLKVVYTIILMKCPHMTKKPWAELVKADVVTMNQMLRTCAKGEELEDVSLVDWDLFRRTLLSTKLGKDLLRSHVEELDRAEGVWPLTQKLSDSVTIKVCAGILILIGAVTLLEIDVVDNSIQQGLKQLDALSKIEAQNLPGAAGAYLCEQIRHFSDNHWADPFNRKIMYLHLNGWTYIDGPGGPARRPGECMNPAAAVDFAGARLRVQQLIDRSPVRTQDLLEACWPDDDCQDRGTPASVVLVDSLLEERNKALMYIFTMLCIMSLLLLFVAVVNRKITMFTRAILQPLRWLVDDMEALASLELLQIFRDLPVKSTGRANRPEEVVEELVQLNQAFHSMQSAIHSWSLYVPPSVVQRLFSDKIEAEIGVGHQRVTILFCDIYGFEDTCNSLEPKEVIALLGRVLNEVAEVIQMHNGTLLEFIGDEVLAVFNAPNPLMHHPLAGALACRDIHRVLDEKNVREKYISGAGNEIEIRCRCGVHTADILAGNIGSKKRIKYGLLGDGINLAARLKALNSRYQTRTLATDVLVGNGNTLRKFDFAFRPVDVVAVKGKSEPTTVYELMTTPATQTPESSTMFEACRKHQEAFQSYQGRSFAEAKDAFREVGEALARAGLPQDKPSQLLGWRCQKFISEPPGPEWDGVDHLARKNFQNEEVPAPDKVSQTPTGSAPDKIGPDKASPGDTVSTTSSQLAPRQPSGDRRSEG